MELNIRMQDLYRSPTGLADRDNAEALVMSSCRHYTDPLSRDRAPPSNDLRTTNKGQSWRPDGHIVAADPRTLRCTSGSLGVGPEASHFAKSWSANALHSSSSDRYQLVRTSNLRDENYLELLSFRFSKSIAVVATGSDHELAQLVCRPRTRENRLANMQGRSTSPVAYPRGYSSVRSLACCCPKRAFHPASQPK